MKATCTRSWKVMSLLILISVFPGWAAAATTFNHIVVFGTSLSDSGNVFALIGEQSTPPYATLDPTLVPGAPYAKGGHHFSNGATWVEQLARPMGLAGTTRPAFQGAGSEATKQSNCFVEVTG